MAASNSRYPDQGFTLIEMMVVLLIMGLLVGLVSAVVRPDERSNLRLEVDRLAELIDIAASESRIGGKSVAWTATATGYRFWRISEGSGWSEITNDDLLRARTLPAGMTISNLRMENQRSSEQMRVEFNAWAAPRSFSVELSAGTVRCTLESSPLGDVSVAPNCGRTNENSIKG
jgi:general secretion pathway protein H